MLFNRMFSLLGISSFKGRLRFLFILLAIIFIIIATIPFNYIGKNQLRKNAAESLDQMMNVQQVFIDSWFEEKLSDIHAVSELPALRDDDLSRIEKEWNRARKSKNPLSLLMIDIDHFKAYNDTYGHQEGDECLIKVTTSIRNTVNNPGDMVYRYGGEEFTVILPETNKQDAKVIAENIRKNIEDLCIPHEGSKVSDVVTVSIGLATLTPTEDKNAKQLIELADNALYEAKSISRNRVCV